MYSRDLGDSLLPKIVVTDYSISYCNSAFVEMAGYDASVITDNSLEKVFADIGDPALYFAELVDSNSSASTRIFDSNHFALPVKIRVKKTEVQNEFLVGFHLISNKSRDAITGLPNGWALRSRVEHSLFGKSEKEKSNNIALLVVDVDHFSTLNFRYSFESGDNYLALIGRELQQSVFPYGIAARFSNAKYGVLIEADQDMTQCLFEKLVKSVCDRVVHVAQQAIDLGNGTSVKKTFSIGVSQSINSYSSYHEMELASESAMLEAKKVCNTSVVYSKCKASPQLVNEKYIIEELPKAILANSINIYYQPQYDVKSGELIAFEALSRWTLPELGPISPDLFISTAEKIGLHFDFDLWVFSQVCNQISLWISHNLKPVKIAVNVSLKSLEMGSFIPQLKLLLNDFDFPLNLLEVEMTETGSISDIEQFRTNIKSLGELGINIAVDDFGTGYSSLNLIREFHTSLSKIKIDRALIMNIETNEIELEFIKHIVKLGELFDLQVLAEGIEKVEQLTLLGTTGCHFAQGYYFSKAVSSTAAETLLKSRTITINR